MIDPKKYYGNYRGIIIQNNDPLYAGRVKVFVPHVNANLIEKWINNFGNDETINHVGKNVNGFSDEIILRLKKVLPWSGTCLPLFGMGTSGFYFSPNNESLLANDSNQSGQQKKNLTSSCEDKKMQQDFKETGSTSGKNPVNSKVDYVQAQSTTYGYPSDPYRDSKSLKGIGNRDNIMKSGQSVALSESTASQLGLNKGDSVVATFPDGKQGVFKYDDTIPPLYSNHRIDFYLKTDQENGQFPYNGSNVKIEKLNNTNKPKESTETSSDVIMPPTFVEKSTCNQGSGGIASQSNNKMDLQNYNGNSGMDGQTKNNMPDETYRNPNDVRGANTLNPDLTLQIRPMNHGNSYKGMMSIPAVGSSVWVFFENGDSQYPVVFGYHGNQAAFQGIHGIENFPKDQQYFD